MMTTLVLGACLALSVQAADPAPADAASPAAEATAAPAAAVEGPGEAAPAPEVAAPAPPKRPRLTVDPVTKIETARKLSGAAAEKLKKARQTLNRCKKGRCPTPQVQALLADAAKDFAAVDLLLSEAAAATENCAVVQEVAGDEAALAAAAEAAAMPLEAASGMDSDAFARLLAEVDAQVFAEDRIMLVRDAGKDGARFSSSQVRALLGKLTQSADRLDLLRAVGRVADPLNLELVYGEIHHPGDLEEARKILEGE